jgi:sialate O-acetylesterase
MSMTQLVIAGLLLVAAVARAEVKLPAIFGDHMVLQRDMPVPVWGTAAPEETVTVTAGTASAQTKAGADGKWMVRLPALKVSATPIELVVAGSLNKVVLHDVLVGDVWVCSGQSNMAFQLKQASNAVEELPKANYPAIRFLSVKRKVALEPQPDCDATWSVCTPDTAKGASAVGYFFIKEIAETQKIPVALINVHLGATPAQAWTSREALQADLDLKKSYGEQFAQFVANLDTIKKTHAEWMSSVGKEYKDAMAKYYQDAFQAKQKGLAEPVRPNPPATPEPQNPDDQTLPTVLFNGMVAPLMPFAVKGVLWYQGESNAAKPDLYRKLFPAMIVDWRKQWGQGDFPFYYVQLPNYRPRVAQPTEGAWVLLRETQWLALDQVPKTGMAITIDVGEANDLHPPRKAEVGHRLALLARHDVYGETIVSSGPLYASHRLDGDKVIITFKSVGKGLRPSEEVKGFAIAGADNKFVWAQAKVTSTNTVSVWSDTVKTPVAIRYGWADNPEVSLNNSADLPASPFRLTVGR